MNLETSPSRRSAPSKKKTTTTSTPTKKKTKKHAVDGTDTTTTTTTTTVTSKKKVIKFKAEVTVLAGRDLAAKDHRIVGAATSDPYVEVWAHDEFQGATPVKKMTLNPQWNSENTCVIKHFEEAYHLPPPKLELKIFDNKRHFGKKDPEALGTITLILPARNDDTTEWYQVPKHSALNAQGELRVRIITKRIKSSSSKTKKGKKASSSSSPTASPTTSPRRTRSKSPTKTTPSKSPSTSPCRSKSPITTTTDASPQRSRSALSLMMKRKKSGRSVTPTRSPGTTASSASSSKNLRSDGSPMRSGSRRSPRQSPSRTTDETTPARSRSALALMMTRKKSGKTNGGGSGSSSPMRTTASSSSKNLRSDGSPMRSGSRRRGFPKMLKGISAPALNYINKSGRLSPLRNRSNDDDAPGLSALQEEEDEGESPAQQQQSSSSSSNNNNSKHSTMPSLLPPPPLTKPDRRSLNAHVALPSLQIHECDKTLNTCSFWERRCEELGWEIDDLKERIRQTQVFQSPNQLTLKNNTDTDTITTRNSIAPIVEHLQMEVQALSKKRATLKREKFLNDKIDKLELKVTILQAVGLVPKDQDSYGRWVSSDPYVEVYRDAKLLGKTATKEQTLDPIWNEQFIFVVNRRRRKKDNGMKENTVTLRLWDEDYDEDPDCLGSVTLNLPSSQDHGGPELVDITEWYPIPRSTNDDKDATGWVQVRMESDLVVDKQLLAQELEGQVKELEQELKESMEVSRQKAVKGQNSLEPTMNFLVKQNKALIQETMKL